MLSSEILKSIRDWINTKRYVNPSDSTTAPVTFAWMVVVSGFVFSFYAFLCQFGLDVTDLGFHLVNQTHAVDTPSFPHWLCFFTEYVGGTWLRLSPWGPSVLWWRLGGSLHLGLSAGLTFLILCRFAPPSTAAFAAVAGWLAVPFATIGCSLGIHYYTFPMLLSFCWLYVFLKSMEATSESRRYAWLFVLGAINGLLIFARAPMLLACGIPFAIAIAHFVRCRDLPVKRLFFYGVVWAAGLGITCLGILAWEIYVGVQFTQKPVPSSSLPHKVIKLLVELISDCISGTAFIALIVVSVELCLRRGRLALQSVGWLFALAISTYLLRYLLFKTDPFILYTIQATKLTHLLIGTGFITVALVVLLSHRTQLPNKHFCLLFAALCLLIITPLGSNTGDIKTIYILPLMLGVGICWIFFNARPCKAFGPLYLVLGITILTMIATQSLLTYRDETRLRCTAQFSIPPLHGLRSTPQRVQTIEELYHAMKKHRCEPGQEMLAVNSIPIVDYLLQTTPWLNMPWPFQLSEKMLQSQFEMVRKEKWLPKWIVLARKNTRNFTWSQDPEFDIDKRCVKKVRFIKNIIRKNDYVLIFSNDSFLVYRIERTENSLTR